MRTMHRAPAGGPGVLQPASIRPTSKARLQRLGAPRVKNLLGFDSSQADRSIFLTTSSQAARSLCDGDESPVVRLADRPGVLRDAFTEIWSTWREITSALRHIGGEQQSSG